MLDTRKIFVYFKMYTKVVYITRSSLMFVLSQPRLGARLCYGFIYLPYTYGLLTKCEVKMAGYWPSSFFACLWTETESRSINTQKKNEANIKPSWPNKLGQ